MDQVTATFPTLLFSECDKDSPIHASHFYTGVRGYLYLDLMEKTEHNPEKLDLELHVVTGIGLQVVSLEGGGKYVLRTARWIYMDGKRGKTEAETANGLPVLSILPFALDI